MKSIKEILTKIRNILDKMNNKHFFFKFQQFYTLSEKLSFKFISIQIESKE